MPVIQHHKVVSSLPSTLTANSIYYVRIGTGFDVYVTNSSGTVVAYPLNYSVRGTADSAAKTSIAVGGRTSIVLDAAGVAVGNAIQINPTGDIGAGMNISHYYVSAAGKITVWLSNTGLVISSIPAMTWNWTILR